MVYKSEIIEEIMDEFDFKLANALMKYINWSWKSCNGVPTVRDLENKALQLLLDVADSGEEVFFSKSGGLAAYKIGKTYILAFEATEFSVDDEDGDSEKEKILAEDIENAYNRVTSVINVKDVPYHPKAEKTPSQANKPYSGPSYRITVDPDGAVVVEIAEDKYFSSWRRYHLVEIQC